MADVLLVYVQEDRAYAEGIGASLERSGLTVADGDGATHGGADALCVLVLWSAHSTRSAIVRDAAIRAQREGKLITAKLAGCEAPLGFARPAPHDLSQWMGDPDDPLLDPLFFAADRMVCAVRLNARPDPIRNDPPRLPPQQIYPQGEHIHGPGNVRPLRAGPIASVGPSTARAARVEPDSASHPHRAEPALPPNVAQEAAAWKRIEHSTDPKDFLDYLTTFSPNGIFCELAQLKLDKLTPKQAKAAFIPHTPSPHVAKPRAAEGTRERRNAARPQPPEARPEPEPPRYAPPREEHPPEPRYEARPDPRPDPRYDPRPPEPRYETHPEPRYEARPDPRYEPRPEPRYEERAEPRYEPRPRPRPESREDYEFESGPLAAPTRSATNRPRRRAPAPQQVRTEPRDGGGLPWRPIVIVALLAAGGVAFFQALPKQAPQAADNGIPGAQDLAEASRAAPLDELSAPGEVAPPALGSGNAPLGGVQAQRTAPARQAPPAQAARPAYQQPAVASAPSSPPPTPIISFLPPQQPAPSPTPAPTYVAPEPAPAAVQPAPTPAYVAPAPAPAAVQPAPAPAPVPTVSATPGPAPSGQARPTWLRRPGAAQLASAYPRRASDAGVSGQAQLNCLIQNDGSLACSAVSSTPSNYGFADAALAVARYFRAAPTMQDGSSAYGKRTSLTIKFASQN